MFCPNCGKKIPEKSKFCPMCGFNIKEFFDNSFKDEPKEEMEDLEFEEKIKENKLEDLFVGNDNYKKNIGDSPVENIKNEEVVYDKDGVNFEDIKSTIKNSQDIEEIEDLEFEEKINYFEGENKDNNYDDKKTITRKEYIKNISQFKNKVILKIKSSQNIIHAKIRKFLQDLILEKNKYKDYLIIFTALTIFIPLIIRLSANFQDGKIGTNILKFAFILLVTIVNLLVTALGPYLSLKILNFNYIKNLDKSTIKSVVLLSTVIISAVNLIIFVIFGHIASMDMILSNKFTIKGGVVTFISIILKTYIIETMIIDRIKEEKYSKVTMSILLGVILAEIASFLIAAPIISLLQGVM
ncbi:zinc ribbon domain-containing protein [Miniphocaeibacter massiliensis]|uniref:zinc ribbon domain-containing protein n=1 Tax=Miniphocaeibacter massiliensis TaxID=2041841 RepID=UPI000C1BEE79|nr:zinc ribbon domain-containing protein [Miniphocaeibacter massiliensis]